MATAIEQLTEAAVAYEKAKARSYRAGVARNSAQTEATNAYEEEKKAEARLETAISRLKREAYLGT